MPSTEYKSHRIQSTAQVWITTIAFAATLLAVNCADEAARINKPHIRRGLKREGTYACGVSFMPMHGIPRHERPSIGLLKPRRRGSSSEKKDQTIVLSVCCSCTSTRLSSVTYIFIDNRHRK